MPRPSYHALFIHQSPADSTAACIATEPNRINHGMTALLFFPRYVFQDDCLPPLPPLRVPPPGHRRLCLRIRRITYHFRLFPIYFDRALPKKKSPLISSTIRVGTPKEMEAVSLSRMLWGRRCLSTLTDLTHSLALSFMARFSTSFTLPLSTNLKHLS